MTVSGFTKGRTYLAKSPNRRFYIIQQVGMKSWKATCFTHVEPEGGVFFEEYTGNGKSLFEKLNEDGFEFRATYTNGKLREYMFEILQHGRWKDI